MVNHLNRQTRSDPPIKRDLMERMNDWCEDELLSWGRFLDRHYGFWCVVLLVFLVTVLSIALTVRLM